MKKNSICKNISETIQDFDNFGFQFNFRFGKHTQYKTIFGGILFSIYAILCSIYVLLNFFNFISRQNLNLTYITKVISPSPEISLDKININFNLIYKNNMTLANYFLDKYFNLVFTYEEFKYKNRSNTNITRLKMTNCNYSNLPTLTKLYFDNFNLRKYFCPIIDDDIKNKTIQGTFVDFQTSYLKIALEIKDEFMNRTSEIQHILNTNPIAYYLGILDTKIDYDNYTNMTSNYISYIYNYIDLRRIKQSDVYLTSIFSSDDTNYLFSIKNKAQDITKYNFEEKDYPVEREISKNNLVSTFYIISSPHNYFLDRTYQKLPDLIANMTGIISECYMFLFILINFTNEKGAYQKILNKFFKYGGSDKYDLRLMTNLINKIQVNPIIKDNIPLSVRNEGSVKYEGSNKKPTGESSSQRIILQKLKIKEKFNIPKKQEFINFNSCSFLFTVLPFFKNKKISKELRIIEKVEEKTNENLSIYTYLKKNEEVEILKNILLDESEKEILEFISFPFVNSKKNKYGVLKERNRHLETKTLIENVNKSYDILSRGRNINKQDETHKLIELFKKEIKKY